ncbi:hypothetical protein EG829_19060, partial [bacterium]|nr:hypothetical protein [bacterium]
VGRSKKRYWPRLVGEPGLKVMGGKKKAFDRGGILNQGKVF